MSEDAGYNSGEGESDLTKVEADMMMFLKIRKRNGEEHLSLLDFTISPLANFKGVYQRFIYLNQKNVQINREIKIKGE